VELHVDVLASVVEHWILCKRDGGLVVYHQCWRSSLFLSDDLLYQPAQPGRLARARGRRSVLCLARRERHDLRFSDCHEIGAGSRKTSTPDVLRRPSMPTAISALL
jgi:hypothetical protein